MQVFELSDAYPFLRLSFPFVAILSATVFGETVRMYQRIGLVNILAGLFAASR